MNRERLDGWLEKGILGLVLATLIYGPLATGAVRPQDFLYIQGLVIGILTLWVVRLWVNPELRLLWPPICWAVLAFVVYAIVRYFQAEVEYPARGELIRILVYAGLFFAVVNNLSRQESAQIVAFTMIVLAVGISAYAIYQFSTKSDRVWHFIRPDQYAGRGSGTYICPNHLAGFLELVLPLALAYTIMGRVGHAVRIGLGYCALVIIAGIGVTVSRGGIIATVIALLVFVVFLARKPGFRIPAAILLALFLGGGIWFLTTAQVAQQRFERSVKNGEVRDVRFELWKPALQMWQQEPWLGVGPEHYAVRFPKFRPPDVQFTVDWVHNDYINTLVDWGIVGSVLVLAVWGLLFDGVRRTWQSVQRSSKGTGAGQSNRAAFAFGGAVALVAILLHSWVDFNLHIPANAIVVVAWIALLTSYWKYATDGFRLGGVAMRLMVTVVALAAIGYLGQQGLRRYRETQILVKLQPGKTLLSVQFAQYQKALEVEPNNAQSAFYLGEAYRDRSWQGADDYIPLAKSAMKWYQVAMRLNPHDALPVMRYGMCLDWLDEHEQAEAYFKRASELDPNNYLIVAHQGWHLLQTQQYAAAKPWFERSIRLNYFQNEMARTYLDIIHQRLEEAKKSN